MVDRQDDMLEATVAELLTEATEEELARRDGEWDAFTASVFRRIDEEAIAVERADLEAQAIELLKQEIDLELSEMAPRFEEAFRESVEKQIFRSAIGDSWKTRVKSWFDSLRPTFSVGWASAAAAALLMVVAVNTMPDSAEMNEKLVAGRVSVQRISFEGDVTVLPDEGVTIIWLDGAAS